jgi:HEAT repeat protein
LALEEIGISAVEPLIGALKDRSKDVRRSAALALGEIGDARAIGPLIDALKAWDMDVRRSAALALEEIGWEPKTPEEKAFYLLALRKLDELVKIGEPAVEPLIGALKDRSKDVRRSAALALGKIRDARAVEPLIDALKDRSKDVRGSAALALGEIGDKRAVLPLIGSLKDSYWWVRRRAALALEKIGWKPRSQDEMIAYLLALEKRDELAKIGEPAIEPLIRVLKDWDQDVRRSAALTLGRIGEPAVEPLIGALKDRNKDVRKSVALALGRIGEPAVEPLIGLLKDSSSSVRWIAASALGEIGDKRAVLPLIGSLEDSDENVRQEAASALGEIGDKRAVLPLISSLKDSYWWVRRRAALALEKMGWKPRSQDEMIAYLLALEKRDELVKIGEPAVEPLIGSLRDSDWRTRRSAALTLGKIGDPRALPELKRVAREDKDSNVRRAAREAIRKIHS